MIVCAYTQRNTLRYYNYSVFFILFLEEEGTV
jgi:hypothetical protein